MGLIKAAKAAIGSTMHDQWKEVIRCGDMGDNILMKSVTSENGIISQGSLIVVDPGQCACLVDNGRVVDATSESGEFTYDASSVPSFFAGTFGAPFKEMWNRFTFNGQAPSRQMVYYFNLKEIMNNKFGTSQPVAFQDWSHPYKNEMTNTFMPFSLQLRCFGTYTFQINNPALFMQAIAGTASTYTKEEITEQMRSEVEGVLQNLLNELGNSNHKVPVLELPSQTDEIKKMMDERVYDEPIRNRGLRIVSFVIQSVSLTEDSQKKIDEYQFSASSALQRARMTEAYSNAMENAASNANGAPAGFIGLGVANMATGNAGTQAVNTMFNSAVANTNVSGVTYDPYGADAVNAIPKPNAPVEPVQTAPTGKKCPKCGNDCNPDAKFCPNCGTQL